MVHIQLKRGRSRDKATLGSLYIDGVFECNTLEDVVRDEKIQNETAIPAGVYQVTIDHSEHFGCDMPHIQNVPNYSGVRIHAGNSDVDTDGCILLGVNTGNPDFISLSRLTFNKFFVKLADRLNSGEQADITIMNEV